MNKELHDHLSSSPLPSKNKIKLNEESKPNIIGDVATPRKMIEILNNPLQRMQHQGATKEGTILNTLSKVLTLPWRTFQAKNLTFFGIFTFHKEAKTESLDKKGGGEGLTKQRKKDLHKKPVNRLGHQQRTSFLLGVQRNSSNKEKRSPISSISLITSNVDFKCSGAIGAFVMSGRDTSLGVGCRVNADSIQSPIPRTVASVEKIRITTSNSARARRGCHSAKSLVNLGLWVRPIVRFVEMKQAKKAKGGRNGGQGVG